MINNPERLDPLQADAEGQRIAPVAIDFLHLTGLQSGGIPSLTFRLADQSLLVLPLTPDTFAELKRQICPSLDRGGAIGRKIYR